MSAAVLAGACAANAEAQESPLDAYARAASLSRALVAEQSALSTRIGGVAESLGSGEPEAFGGLWVDAVDDEPMLRVAVVAKADDGARARLRDDARRSGAERGFVERLEFVEAAFSDREIRATTARLSTELVTLIGDDLVRVGYSPRDNAAVVQVAEAVSADERRTIDKAINDVGADRVRVEKAAEIGPVPPATCGFPHCDRPLHGGVEITGSGKLCSAGPHINVDGSAFVATTNHCFFPTCCQSWSATHQTTGNPQVLGTRWNGELNANGDWALIHVPYNTFWTQIQWLPYTVVWGLNHNNPVNASASSVQGAIVCKTGRSTNVTCGTVTMLGASTTYANAVDYPYSQHGTIGNLVITDSMCLAGGDSGGTVTLGYGGTTVVGMAAAGACNGTPTFYAELAAMMNRVPAGWIKYVVTQ